jgi:hypothetical protein
MPVVSTPFVDKSLITTVPASLRLGELQQFGKVRFVRGENHQTRVEYIRPTDIWHGREPVVEREEMGEGACREDVCIKENDLLVLREPESVEFGQNGRKVRTT